jgi:hypothetical protein
MNARRDPRGWMMGLSAVALTVFGTGVVAQQAQPEAQGTGLPEVSTPEPAPNPVREMRGAQAAPSDMDGMDPELGAIAEPDADPVSPALRSQGGGDWVSPEEELRRRLREEAMAKAGEIQRKLEAERALAGPIMPRLMAPTIPIVPLDLLFPPEMQSSGPPPVRESRGSVVEFGALDRETGETSRVRVPVGRSATIGSLHVKVDGCFLSHPEDSFESWAYVTVVDKGRARAQQLAVLPQRDRARMREGNVERTLRKGWIIASSPAVTPIDHPTYDMWLTRCEGYGGEGPEPQWRAGSEPPNSSGSRAASPAGAGATPASPATRAPKADDQAPPATPPRT